MESGEAQFAFHFSMARRGNGWYDMSRSVVSITGMLVIVCSTRHSGTAVQLRRSGGSHLHQTHLARFSDKSPDLCWLREYAAFDLARFTEINAPDPWRKSSNPSCSSSEYALAIVVGLIISSSASVRMPGSWSPYRNAPFSTVWHICCISCR